MFRVVNTAKKNQPDYSNKQCLPEQVDISMLPHSTSLTNFHFRECCEIPTWADRRPEILWLI